MNVQKIDIQTPRAFLPLIEPRRYKGIKGGRGSGKSHFAGEMLIEDHLRFPGLRSVCIREVQKDLKDSAKKLLEDKIKSMGVYDRFDILNNEIRCPGDGLIVFTGMTDHNDQSIKSLEGFGRAWIEEAQTISSGSLEMLTPTIRNEGSEIWATWNPRNASDPIDKFFANGAHDDDMICVTANYNDNPFFPNVLEAERLRFKRDNPERYAHVWLGAYEPMVSGAIWNREVLENTRFKEMPDLTQIVVSIDPAVSNTEHSDKHGIIVAGLTSTGMGVVLEDASIKGSPAQWAERAWAMFDKWEADRFVVEINQGGDMVKHTLESVNPLVPMTVSEVRATKGKHVRAEPIAALYKTGKIGHSGTFEELENEMCQITASGYEGTGSPDRADAMVWAFSDLFPRIIKPRQSKPFVQPKSVSVI